MERFLSKDFCPSQGARDFRGIVDALEIGFGELMGRVIRREGQSGLQCSALLRRSATNRLKNVPETAGDQEDETSIGRSGLYVSS